MPTHYTHEQITEQVKRHVLKHFKGSNTDFIAYTGVNSGNFYRMMNGQAPWADAVLDAIKYEREKLAYVRAKK